MPRLGPPRAVHVAPPSALVWMPPRLSTIFMPSADMATALVHAAKAWLEGTCHVAPELVVM